MKYDWTKEEMARLAPDIEPPSVEFHANWQLVYFKLLEARKELEDIKEEAKQAGWDRDLAEV